MNLNKSYFFLIMLIVLILAISAVSANEDTTNNTIVKDISLEVSLEFEENTSQNEVLQVDESQNSLETNEDDFIVVNDWNELQYYCSQTGKNYNLKLKENTNYYPDNPSDSNYQIKIKNNVKIVGSNGSYIGDASPNARGVDYALLVVESNAKVAMHLENITFKWIEPKKNYDIHKIIQMNCKDKYTNVLKNCIFDNIGSTQNMYDYLVTMGSGKAILDNCSFINCWSTEGLVRVSDSKMNKTTHMILQNCYFAGNHAAIAPGCVYNSGKLTVINSSFIGNGAGYWAGAIHTTGYGNTTIIDSYFKDNVAGWNGGALYTYAYLQIYNTTFINNHCTTNNGGGAIGACQYVSTPHIYIQGCLFKENKNNCWGLDEWSTTGTGRGGAISFMDGGSIEVRDTNFIANSASIGTAICAWAFAGYGSPNVFIVNNSFINHTRAGDTLNVKTSGTPAVISDNYFSGNSIEFSKLQLTKLIEDKEQATLQITVSLTNPTYYDSDILDKTLYDVYINNNYIKTVNSTVFSVDFGDLDICDVYVIPTISNQKSNVVTVTSTREYIFVSKSNGNDNNTGTSRDNPVNTIKRALELATVRKNIILLDGDYSENLEVNYDAIIKGENNATLTNNTSFTTNSDFTLKNLKISNLNTDIFIRQSDNNLTVQNCIFENNTAGKLIEAKNINILKSVFNNNNALLINNLGFASIKDSILLNNADIIQGNNNYALDYNWWGSTLENPNNPVNLNIDNWLILNATGNVNALEVNQVAQITFGFYLNGIKYTNLPEIYLNLTPVNGIVNSNFTNINSEVTYTLTALADGYLTVGYNNVQTKVDFQFLKSNPNISITAKDVMYGDALTVTVNAPKDVNGNITVKVGNQTQNKTADAKTTFTFINLKAGNYIVNVSYSGDDKYLAQDKTSSVNVNKYESTTNIDFTPIVVDEDLTVLVSTLGDAAGNVTLSINGEEHILYLNQGNANYTISKIPRGDYNIKAFYNGDDKYLTSQSSTKIEVDNLNATMEITADDITYGETAIIKIRLNDDAKGNVTVEVDGIANTSQVTNGMAEIHLNNLGAGINKNITVFYTGDNTYFNLTKNATFTINKANLTFNISYEDVMIGQDVVIRITVPERTQGTFTVNGKTFNIPLAGEVECIFEDLNIGEHEFAIVYNGNNYNTFQKDIIVNVNEYPAPQVPNTETDGKSDYTSLCNGEISFSLQINESINGITIDSEGNIYITTSQGIYSYASNGSLRWIFTSDDVHGNFSASVIGRDIVITPKSGDKLYFVNQTSGLYYGYSNLYQGSSLFSPIIDTDANVYTLSELQRDTGTYDLVKIPYKIWENGGTPISVSLGKYAPSAFTISDDFILVVMEGRIRLIDIDTLETIFTKTGNYQPIKPIIGEGNIIYAILDDSIVSYTISGERLWKTKVTGGVGSQLLLDSEVGVYMVNANGNLYRYDSLTGKESFVCDLKITSGVLIDANHNLYFGCDNLFYEITSGGKILWKSDINDTVTGKPVMDKNGTVYVTTTNNKVFAITQGELRDPNLNMTIEGDVLTITVDMECIGNITFVLDNKTYNTNTISISNLSGGEHVVNATYSGDLIFAKTSKSFTFFVKNKIDDIGVTVQGSTVTFSLPSDATGTLTINANGKTYAKTLTNGKATITLADGTYSITVAYSGDSKYAGFVKTVKFTVKKPVTVTKKASKIVAKKKTFKAKTKTKKYTVTLKSGKTPIRKVKLTIKIKNKTYKATTNNKGKATFKIKKLTRKGKYAANIKFAGNKNYKATSKKVKIVIK